MLVIEFTTMDLWRKEGDICKPEKNIAYKDPCPHFHAPHITIGYFPMNKEESKLNMKPEVPSVKCHKRDQSR